MMKNRDEKCLPAGTPLTRRARLDALLFGGAKPDLALSTPKLPPMAGEP